MTASNNHMRILNSTWMAVFSKMVIPEYVSKEVRSD